MAENQYIQRVRRTKHAVCEALAALLKEKSLQQISVRELCTLAGINRSTFYHHYGSPYDVLKEMGDELLNDIAGQLSATSADDPKCVERQVAQCFQSAKDHAQLFLLLLGGSVDKTFAERLFSLPPIKSLLSETLLDCPEEEKKMTIDFAIHGSCCLLTEWLDSGCPQPPEEEAACILRLARRVCRREQTASETEQALQETVLP